MEEKKYMSVEEASELWNIPKEKVWKWCIKSKHVTRTNKLMDSKFIDSNYIFGIPAQLELTTIQEEIKEIESEEERYRAAIEATQMFIEVRKSDIEGKIELIDTADNKTLITVEDASKSWNVPENKIVDWALRSEHIRRPNEYLNSKYKWGILANVEPTTVQAEIKKYEEEREKKNKLIDILKKVCNICCVIVVISFLISLFSCGVVNSNSNYISDGYGNYSFSGSTFSGLQLFLFFVYLAMPLILYGIREGLYISPVKKIIIIIALTIITLVFVFPNMLEPGSSYSSGNFLGYRW